MTVNDIFTGLHIHCAVIILLQSPLLLSYKNILLENSALCYADGALALPVSHAPWLHHFLPLVLDLILCLYKSILWRTHNAEEVSCQCIFQTVTLLLRDSWNPNVYIALEWSPKQRKLNEVTLLKAKCMSMLLEDIVSRSVFQLTMFSQSSSVTRKTGQVRTKQHTSKEKNTN